MVDVVQLKPVADPDPPERFKPGHVVMLRSGGARMTVRKATKGYVIANWHDSTGALISDEFLPVMLMFSASDDQEGDADE